MKSEQVTFYSEGSKVVGTLHLPEQSSHEKIPIVVQGPGWLEKACSPISERFHESFAAGGYAILHFDYRGFGLSEGEPGWIRPDEQITDIINALTYVETRKDLDASRIALFGSGGTGGGNALYAAAYDERVKSVIIDNVVADGSDWLRRMRREYEWHEFQKRVQRDQRIRVLENKGEIINPTEELMVSTPERREIGMPTFGKLFHLGSAQYLKRYKPLDVVHRIAPRPLLIVCTENDAVTPEEHSERVFSLAGPPKRMIKRTGVGHYEAYAKFHDIVMSEILDWLNRYLLSDSIAVRSEEPGNQ